MSDLFFWLIIFVFSLILLVKGSDWFVESSEKIGLALKISPFIIGVTIVALGTSLPELASSLSATFKGTTEIVTANVIGSNIFNILVIVGLSAVVAYRMTVQRSLIDLDLPLLAISTIIFLFISFDKRINVVEGILLILTFIVYLSYTIFQRREKPEETLEIVEVLPSRVERREREAKVKREKEISPPKLNFGVFLFLILGFLAIFFGADYTIEALKRISEILKISPSIISIIALAAGTSLPELFVSVQSAAKKKYEISLGNIFGSNVFNGSFIVGVCALFKPLEIEKTIFLIGLPFLFSSTLLFVISGISKRIHIWEGLMYILLYILFVVKLFNLF